MPPMPSPEPGVPAPPGAQPDDRATLEPRLRMFERVLANIPDVVARFDRQLRHVYVSPAIVQVTGLATEAFIGRSNRDLGMPADLVSVWEAALQQVFATGAPQRMTFTFPGPGTVYHYDSRLVPEFGPAGDVETVLAVTRDVTAQVQAEQALREREELFRRTFDQSPIGAALVGLDYQFLRVNTALCQITDYTEDDLLARRFTDITHPDDVGTDTAQAEALRAGEIDQYMLDKRYIRRDGQVTWVHLSVRLLRDAAGAPVAFMPLIEDITARRQAEEALRASETRFRLVLQASPVTVFTHDRGLRYTWIYNPVEPAHATEIIGKTDADLFSAAEAAPLMQLKQDVLDTGASVRREVALTIGGQRVIFDTTYEPLRDGAGAVDGLVGVAINVTEHVREAEQRTALERRLQEAQRLESIGVLAGGIAHDFNNLLAIVLGNADLALADLPADSAVRPSLQQISSAAHRGANLTRQLLIYSGHGQFETELLDVSEIVRDNAVLLEASVTASARLVFDLAPELPPVLGDATLLGQVLLNLVVNAAEAIGSAAGTIRISTGAVDLAPDDLARCQVGRYRPAGRFVRMSVADSGAGIPESLLPRIFEPFVTTRFAGRGLGLAVVQGIVQRHGGAISVSTTPGEGSEIAVLLPAVPSRPARPVLLAPASELRWPGTILVVDDEAGVRLLIGRMVEHFGFAALLAADGRSALELVNTRAREMACVLLDSSLPDVDGVQVWREARRVAPLLPVIVMSGYRADDVTRNHVDLRGVPFIQKPFTLEALRAALERVGVLQGDAGG